MADASLGTRPRLMSQVYEREFAALLRRIESTPGVQPVELTAFWPKIGGRYAGDLMIVGRSVNGWVDRWVPGGPMKAQDVAAQARATGEWVTNEDQLGWVLDRWKRRDGRYDTSRSQFWETIRLITTGLDPAWSADWPSRITWTNLVKVAPWKRGNPGGPLLDVQRQSAPALLDREIEELDPQRVVVFAGRWWFEPFASALGLAVDWRDGLVEGVAKADRRWVVAVHPMTRSPRRVADEVIAALAE